jgi:type I restriction enzyme, S subunit
MKSEWEEMTLRDILQLEYGKPLDEADRKPDGKYPVYGANGEKDRSDKFYFDKPSIIVGRKGSAGEVNLTEPKFWPLDVTYFVTFNEREHDLQFLFYLLTTLDLPSLAKGVKPGINRNEVYSQVVKVPPLPEQRRIVGILDEAFEGIATAKANAEKNLQNARALFESHLHSVFSRRGKGWVEKRLVDVCVLQRGFDLPTRSRISGNFPLVSSSGIIDTHNEGPVKGPGVATGRSGSIGNVFYIKEDYWPLNTVLYVREFYNNNPKFIYRLLSHFDLKRFATGAGVPTLNRNFVHDERVVVPESNKTQREIAEKLDALEEETQRLASLYERKLAALEALQKSLLHQAFSGNLGDHSVSEYRTKKRVSV